MQTIAANPFNRNQPISVQVGPALITVRDRSELKNLIRNFKDVEYDLRQRIRVMRELKVSEAEIAAVENECARAARLTKQVEDVLDRLDDPAYVFLGDGI